MRFTLLFCDCFISIHIMSPYIAHNDMTALLSFIWFPDKPDLMSVGDILPLSLFLTIHPSTCGGGGILAYFVKLIKYRPLRFYRKLHLLFIPRMSKGKLPGAESHISLAGHLRSGRIVFQIAQKRGSMTGKLNADLMVASCLQIDFHESERALLSLQLLQNPIA